VAGSDIDDELKFSQAPDAEIQGNVSSTGGEENACDINNHSCVTVKPGAVLRLTGGDQAGLLVKGGSKFVVEPGGLVLITPSPKSKCDVLVDDWSDQSQLDSVVDGEIRRTDDAPVRFVWGRGTRPEIVGPSAVQWLWTIGLHFYNPIKGLIRRILKIPTGVKGPRWF
jgi:hypothetical protein